ncbi:protein YgfX [Solimonas soli]|uniref:protein YgfX n=1 Tax=Solimonas soli TaxID=413479 RepID=UPI0004B4E4F5|nr:protein YgfX [Solimonas soli]
MPSSSNSFASTVDLRLRPSLRALRVIFIVHVLCIGLLPLAMQPGIAMLALAGGFAASWFWLRRHPALGFGPRAITRLVWHADGSWNLFFGDKTGKAELLPHSLVHAWLLVLDFRADNGRRYTRVIAGGEADAEPLRRLRARLRMPA